MRQYMTKLDGNVVDKCRDYASFRRTLKEAVRLLDAGIDADDFDVHRCIQELREIMPAIEALQHAARNASLVAIATRKPPYPFCRHPDKCSGKGYCQFDPACNK